MKSKTIGVFLCTFLVASMVLSSCKSTPTTTTATATTTVTTSATTVAPKEPYGSLTIASALFDIDTFDIIKISGANYFQQPMYDWLVWKDWNGKNIGIADSWSMATDGLSWTFKLRQGVKFHDGTEVTADDVVFVYSLYLLPEAAMLAVKTAIDRVVAVDRYTVQIFTKGTQVYLDKIIGQWSTTGIGRTLLIPKAYYEKVGKDEFARNPIGTGPYKYVSHVLGVSVGYEAVGNYRTQVPAFKTLNLLLVPEAQTRVALLKTGGIDIAELPIDIAKNVTGFQKKAGQVSQVALLFLGANGTRSVGKPIADINVRTALSIAINRQEISDTIFGGQMILPPMPYSLSPSQPEIDDAYWQAQGGKYYVYDKAKAISLLTAAGYTSANPLTITFWDPAITNNAFYTAIQGYWEAIGVKVNYKKSDFATFRPLLSSGPDKLVDDSLVGTACMTTATAFPYHSNISSAYNDLSFWNLFNNSNPSFITTLKSSYTEPDPAKRLALYNSVLQQIMDARLSEPIGHLPYAIFTANNSVDISAWPVGGQSACTYAEYAKHAK